MKWPWRRTPTEEPDPEPAGGWPPRLLIPDDVIVTLGTAQIDFNDGTDTDYPDEDP